MCRTSTFIDQLFLEWSPAMIFTNEYCLASAIGYCRCAIDFIPKFKEEAKRVLEILDYQFIEGTYRTSEALERAIRNEKE